MKRPNFLEGTVVGVIASIAASALFATLVWFFNPANVLELIVTGISFGYILYLLARSNEKTGRVVVLTAWSIIATLAWMLSLPLTLFIFVHVTLLWLVRSLYFYSSLLSSLIDMGLTGLSLAVALWAGMHTSSLFLSIWCFFLIQALFVTIPARINRPTTTQFITPEREDTFESAHRSAETALRQLSTIS
jgi:hypothetical protein